MSEIEEWAKREAERFKTIQSRTAGEWGILHLAEQLQREDVIEAGARGIDPEAFLEPEWSMVGAEMKPRRQRAIAYSTAALAAMLAKIAEGGAS